MNNSSQTCITPLDSSSTSSSSCANQARKWRTDKSDMLRHFQGRKQSLRVHSGNDSTYYIAAQYELQLRVFLVAALDKADLAAA